MRELGIREIQMSSLAILNKISEICEAQSINYSLAYGTLLGAVRHKGFIPWDDDLDIMMCRPEYERFIDFFMTHQDEMHPLKLLNMDTETKCPHVISRVTNTDYYLDVNNENDYGLGTFVDVYVVDGLGNTKEDAEKVIKDTMDYPSLIFLSTRKRYHFGMTKGRFKKLKKIFAFVYAKTMGKMYFVHKLNQKLNRLDYNNSKYVGIAAWGERPKDPQTKVMKKEWIDDTFLVDFEQHQFRISRYYDEILKLNYGDYMKLPPEKDRVQHHLYKAYKK